MQQLADVRRRLFREPFRMVEPLMHDVIADAVERRDDDALLRGRVLLGMALIYRKGSQGAADVLQRALAMPNANTTDSAWITHYLGAAALWTGDLASARSWNDQARTAAASTDDPHLLAEATCYHALLLDRAGRHDDALQTILKAITLHERYDDAWTRSFIERWCAVLMQRAGSMIEALRHALRSVAIADDAANLTALARALSTSGSIHIATGNLKSALDDLVRASQLFDQLEITDWFVAESILSTGNVYARLHDADHAMPWYERALEMWRDLGDLAGEARTLERMADVHVARGEFEEAIIAHEGALGLFHASPQLDPDAALPLVGLGVLHHRMGHHARAMECLEHAVEKARATQALTALSQALTALGRMLLDASTSFLDVDRAGRCLDEALALREGGGMDTSEVLGLLAETYERLGDTARALTITKRYHDVLESHRALAMRELIANIETQKEVAEARRVADMERLRAVELAAALRDLKEAQTKLVNAEKMASLGQLTAGVAHEINNPVTFIASSVGPLRRDIEALLTNAQINDPSADELRHEIQQLLTSIEIGARRTAEIVKGLRSFSRMDDKAKARYDVHDGIDSTLVLLTHQLRDGIKVVKHYADLPTLNVNGGQLNQVFMNLLSNAIHALQHAVSSVADPTITITTERGDNDVVITIADNGPGMPSEIAQRIFEPFFTTKDVGIGTGLGLAIVHGIIDAHGGSISVATSPGAGAAFTVRLPIEQP